MVFPVPDKVSLHPVELDGRPFHGGTAGKVVAGLSLAAHIALLIAAGAGLFMALIGSNTGGIGDSGLGVKEGVREAISVIWRISG